MSVVTFISPFSLFVLNSEKLIFLSLPICCFIIDALGIIAVPVIIKNAAMVRAIILFFIYF
ncbi:MAG: hypothetical protein DRO67_08055 [Candidatus Asgardarchaeum californiense]|nr:MAG: hypothetical protein DRO67_08055 [Candidatus Asgardarchaeum californiense]